MNTYNSEDSVKCAICEEYFNTNSNGKFTRHLKNSHSMTLKDYLLEYFFNNEDKYCPSCGLYVLKVDDRCRSSNKCPVCSKITREPKVCPVCLKSFVPKSKKESENRVYCSWDCSHAVVGEKISVASSKKTKEEKAESKRKMWKTRKDNGYKHEAWNKGKTGIYTKETIDKIRKATIKQMEEQRFFKSDLEKTFETLIKQLGISYKCSYHLDGKIFDFCIPQLNILIECDGDYWHCNASIEKMAENRNKKMQQDNMKNDILKNIIAHRNGFLLIRFWETEVKNYPELVMEKLRKYISVLQDNQQPSC